jgi:hypothetical protein
MNSEKAQDRQRWCVQPSASSNQLSGFGEGGIEVGSRAPGPDRAARQSVFVASASSEAGDQARHRAGVRRDGSVN